MIMVFVCMYVIANCDHGLYELTPQGGVLGSHQHAHGSV